MCMQTYLRVRFSLSRSGVGVFVQRPGRMSEMSKRANGHTNEQQGTVVGWVAKDARRGGEHNNNKIK